MRARRPLFLLLLLAAALLAALVTGGNGPGPARSSALPSAAAAPDAERTPAPAPVAAAMPSQTLPTAAARPTPPAAPCTRIAPGTPAAYRQPYLSGFTPVAIWKDGTQVYRGFPFRVRQADGSMQVVPTTVTIRPQPVAALLTHEQPAPPAPATPAAGAPAK